MSNIQVSKLQIVDPKYWSGLTREEHLAWLGDRTPQYIDNRLERIYEINSGDDNFISFVNKFPIHEIDEDKPYRWRLMGADERNIPLAKASLTTSGSQVASTETAGIYNGVFYMWFPEAYFFAASHIVGENPETYQVRILENPVPDGTLWRYKVQHFSSDNNLYIPYGELAQGTRWKELFVQTEQSLSIRGGGIHHASHFEMENIVSMIRKSYDVPGNMIGAKNPVMGMVTDNGEKKQVNWINKQEWDFFTQFRRDKARLYLYGKSNKMDDGTFVHKGESGNTIRSGFGLYEQMEAGNLMWFNTFDIDTICDFAMQMSVNKIAEDSRKFVLSTGEWGALEFHRAAQGKASNISWLRSDQNFKDGGKTLTENQINKYVFVNGIEFYVIKDPMKDNPIMNTVKFKNGLASSYSYDIWDFGTTNGEPNIQRVGIKGFEEVYKVIPGLRDPYSPSGTGTTPGLTASSVDGYSLHKAFWGGIMVRNVKKTARFIPAVLR